MTGTNKPRILFLTNDLSPGGVQRIVVDLANRFTRMGYDISVAVFLDRPGSDVYKAQLTPEISFVKIGFTKFWDLRAWFRLYRYLRSSRFDIVFTQMFMADFFGRTAAFLAGTPVIVTEIQNLIPHLPRRYIWTDRVLRSITDLCISPAPAITAYARDVIGYPAEKLLELPTNAVDEHRFAAPINREEIRASIGIPPHAKLILSVGRLIEQKGHTFLLRALPLVLGEVPDVFVAIAGDGELREPLREEARRLGIANRVKLLGARHDVPNLLRSADVFVFPSLYEGQGLVLFETIFARLPIVASDVGGIPDAIEDGETGLLAQPGNPESLAKALIRMLRDGQLRKKVSDEAFRRYSNRTVGESAKRLAEVFGKLYDRKVSRKT